MEGIEKPLYLIKIFIIFITALLLTGCTTEIRVTLIKKNNNLVANLGYSDAFYSIFKKGPCISDIYQYKIVNDKTFITFRLSKDNGGCAFISSYIIGTVPKGFTKLYTTEIAEPSKYYSPEHIVFSGPGESGEAEIRRTDLQ